MEERREERRLTTADMANASSEPSKSTAAPSRQGREQGTMVAEPAAAHMEKALALFPGTEGTRFRERWDAIQTGFVDEPRRAVEQADALVAEVMQRLAQLFADERAKLEGQWSRGDDISTEDLRQALRRYRGFFDRLLSV
jgi:hypothetical protein